MSHPSAEDDRSMSTLAIDLSAENFARRLEDRERERGGVSLPVARAAVARRTGVSAGTLENLRRGRIKGVREWIAERLRAALIAELEADIVRAEHELTVLRAATGRLAAQQALEVEASIDAARRTLRGEG